jgi:cytochrome c553
VNKHNERGEPASRRRWRAATAARLLGLALLAHTGFSAAQGEPPAAAAPCSACHGDDGNSVIPMFPKIAGLQESYIAKQLRDFKSGRRKSDVMAPIVAGIKAEDIAPLAAHFSRLPLKPGSAAEKASADLGKLLYFDGNEETGVPACVGCHQAKGTGFQIYPRIGGQHVEYVKQQLKNFASGDRSNDANRFMRSVAKRLSEEEIESVAAYLVGLDSQSPR